MTSIFFVLSVMPDIAPFSKHLVATNFGFLTQATQQHQIKSQNRVQSQSRPGLSKLSA